MGTFTEKNVLLMHLVIIIKNIITDHFYHNCLQIKMISYNPIIEFRLFNTKTFLNSPACWVWTSHYLEIKKYPNFAFKINICTQSEEKCSLCSVSVWGNVIHMFLHIFIEDNAAHVASNHGVIRNVELWTFWFLFRIKNNLETCFSNPCYLPSLYTVKSSSSLLIFFLFHWWEFWIKC